MDRHTVKRLISETESKKVYVVADKTTGSNYFMEINQVSLDSNNLELIGAAFAPFHTNTVKCHKLANNDKECIILMEYHQGKYSFVSVGTDLCSLIEDYKAKGQIIPETQVWKFIGDILFGLHFLHENKVTYRRIRPENVIVDYKGRARVKMDLENYSYKPYTSEELTNESYRCGNDMLSLGCIAYSLCTLEVHSLVTL